MLRCFSRSPKMFPTRARASCQGMGVSIKVQKRSMVEDLGKICNKVEAVVEFGIGLDRKLQERDEGLDPKAQLTTGWIMEGWLELG